ncbi:integral membrane protein [Rutstroemia sp. NJR-2017a WRK4]|nr:integral membrane protein [Rutstroemia sp. NJR-2017a WRK4]
MISETTDTNLDPLPIDMRNGMIAMGLFGLVSTISTFSLMSFITYRMIYWKRYYDRPIHRNQIFVLIYNLLLADFQQALSFLLSFYWLAQRKLVGGNTQCFGQGWLIQIGDVSSGLWVLAIAIHTFVNLVAQKQIRHRTFVIGVIAIWVFCLLLTAIGPILSKDEFFVPAGAWCWISDTHESERLYLHYLWIFISQLGSLVIYISIFFSLRGRLMNSSPSHPSLTNESHHDPGTNSTYKNAATTTTTIISPSSNAFAVSRHRILKTARYMVVYPFAYVALTLPLAAARVSSMAGRPPPLIFFPVAGSLMASCGIIDVLLYISTRKALVRTNVGLHGSKFPDSENALRRFESSARAQSIRMKGLGRINSDELPPVNEGSMGNNFSKSAGATGGLGDIVVSKSVVLDSEESQYSRNGSTTPRMEDSRSGRSDSLKSLVGGKEDFLEQQKGWRS